jgi:hypothetical protein
MAEQTGSRVGSGRGCPARRPSVSLRAVPVKSRRAPPLTPPGQFRRHVRAGAEGQADLRVAEHLHCHRARHAFCSRAWRRLRARCSGSPMCAE